jgi:hypothetical protein
MNCGSHKGHHNETTMTNHKSDSRLSIHSYFKAIERVEIQFALIRFALKTLSKAKIQRFYQAHLQAKLSAVESCVQQLKEDFGNDMYEGLDAMMREQLTKEHRKQNRPGDTRFMVEFSEDRLNQSELLLLVAHFESFMKDVHSRFLMAAPGKVFSKRDTKVMLRDLFDAQGPDAYNGFLNELVIKEVKSLDAQRIEKRAEYFSEHYGISFGSDKDIEDLKEIMQIRNKISHEIYAPPPGTPEEVRDQALVADQTLKRARQLIRLIPSACIHAGAREYHRYFR